MAKETSKESKKTGLTRKSKLTSLSAKVDKDALKVFAEAPKMAVTVVSFITSAGAIMYRLAASSKAPEVVAGVEAQSWASFDSVVAVIAAVLFVVGLLVSFYSIVLSYGMVSSITACFLEITDDGVDAAAQEKTWKEIRQDEYPQAERVMLAAVFIWMIVILMSAFKL